MKQSLRERKKAKTRRELATAAVRLFTERGFASVTIEEIAEEAMVSPRTVQRYFGTKTDIVFADHEENLATFRDTITEELAAGASLARALRAAVLAVARASLKNDTAVQRYALLEREPVLSARWLQNALDYRDFIALTIAKELRTERDDFRVLVAASAIHGAIRAGWSTALKSWAGGTSAHDPEPLYESVFNLIECGLDSLQQASSRRETEAIGR